MAMSAAGFEARYREHSDPWGYTHSSYEREKYAATLVSCGRGPFSCALELGGSIGVFSALLAPRCRRLVTVDAAPTAVAAARARLGGHPQVQALVGPIPAAVPDERYDLVVASEILYYLTPDVLAQTLVALESMMLPGARLVAVHWRPPGPERPLNAEQVHSLLRQQPWLVGLSSGGTDDYRLDVLERR
jgi:Nodulation protein S (NodS)